MSLVTTSTGTITVCSFADKPTAKLAVEIATRAVSMPTLMQLPHELDGVLVEQIVHEATTRPRVVSPITGRSSKRKDAVNDAVLARGLFDLLSGFPESVQASRGVWWWLACGPLGPVLYERSRHPQKSGQTEPLWGQMISSHLDANHVGRLLYLAKCLQLPDGSHDELLGIADWDMSFVYILVGSPLFSDPRIARPFTHSYLTNRDFDEKVFRRKLLYREVATALLAQDARSPLSLRDDSGIAAALEIAINEAKLHPYSRHKSALGTASDAEEDE